ncbi:hypothetical protein BJ546DRAFT_409182 [Cryomyces antarcticus]
MGRKPAKPVAESMPDLSPILGKHHRHTDTQTHRHTDTDTQTHTDTHRHTQTHTDTHRHTDTGTQTYRHTNTQTRLGCHKDLQVIGVAFDSHMNTDVSPTRQPSPGSRFHVGLISFQREYWTWAIFDSTSGCGQYALVAHTCQRQRYGISAGTFACLLVCTVPPVSWNACRFLPSCIGSRTDAACK